jgi:hypothetical protein
MMFHISEKFWKIFILEIGVLSTFQIFSGKISVKVLSPLYRHPKNPILRGDTGGGRGTPIG